MINVLDKSIFNLIAAGEVVERPASVVKELVENSIDAGATEILIEIKGGGRESIKVSDNGCGILREDLQKAFLPHATSKVFSAEDLEAIGTLGFRGEALSSISAVSRVTATSKTYGETFGGMVTVVGGVISEVEDAGCADGTTIRVEDLFFNVPARAKFLKSQRSESMEITNTISRLILANPCISFKYISNGDIVYLSSGNGIESAILAVYGQKTLDLLYKVEGTVSDIVVCGYVGSPELARPTRTGQTLVVNGRYVVNTTVSKAVFDGFEGRLMRNQFPFFVLNLTVPYERVDVNVHPNKLDVRFSDSNVIYRAFRSAVREAVKGTVIPEIQLDGFSGLTATDEPTASDNDGDSALGYNPLYNITSQSTPRQSAETLSSPSIFPDLMEKMHEEISEASGAAQYKWNAASAASVPEIVEDKSSAFFGGFRIGTMFSTYLLVENGDTVYFIDQHAAHEKILYDQFKSRFDAGDISTQSLLIPYVFDVGNADFDIINANLTAMRALGFEIDPLSAQSFKISAVPAVLTGIKISEFVNLIIGDKNISASKVSDLAEDKLARHACRAAVKGGDRLSDDNVEALLQSFEKNGSLQCPHGRPIVLRLHRKEIEKWFKRIV